MRRAASLFLVLLCLLAAPSFAADGGLEDAGTAITVAELPDGGLVVIQVPPGAPDISDDFVGFLRDTRQLAKDGQWGKLIFFIITALVWVTRVIAARFKVKWLASGLAAIISSFLWAMSGALATTWGAGDPLTAGDFFQALNYGFSAAGGWSVFSFILQKMAERWAWAKWLCEIVIGKTQSA